VGHIVPMHGRSGKKLDAARAQVGRTTAGYLADLSVTADVVAVTQDGLDARFMVNTVAPFILTLALLRLIGAGGRIINLSSAAQAPVNLASLQGGAQSTGPAPTQSTIWWMNVLWAARRHRSVRLMRPPYR